ncbi:MAG: MFS transporter [Thermoguttaceae bacterium]
MLTTLRKDLRTSTAEGMAASVMVGIGETYLPVFVLILTGSRLACGLVTTVPLVIGAVLQLASPWLMRRCGLYRQCVSLCAVIQAATFLPLLVAAVAGHMPIVLVFALVAVYWATGLGSSGPWNAWMETLVPPRLRARYFAWRTRVCQWGVALGFVGGGVALQLADGWGIPLTVFALLFFIASASRFTSASVLASQREPQPPRSGTPRPALTAIFSLLTDGPNGRLLLYLMAAQAAVQIAGPYFNPYMLSELHFSYSIYVIVVCASIVARILFLPTVGRIADRVGVRRVFWISAAAIVPASALWLASNNWVYLVAIQIYSGVAWCAFDLATLLLFFETIPRQKRADVLAFFNLATSAATAAGSVLGAGILAAWGANRHAYLVLFLLSTIARAAAIVLLVRIPARTVTGDVVRAIPAPHYLRPKLPRRAVRAAKVRKDVAGSSRL